ncbi:MAG: GNAT family N-acetyltransferase [Natronomonas sp.]|jgi:GNAT superfamily N-acetyltransferase|uniref:GNAT family N-acetyltransferase n=1 Tax=Natronomonas salsuginis TaxID=2217661 RepID=A0A4U5JF78_9EURY|nr:MULTISPECIES: GNAT family N-acetyltransferase [Natronomonas]MDR9430130.1 GNAT family N-acetyltransferase [Natronomonas sp.]TKR26337.1 GNAT family N-acetyltransferase [Natronomonas salsuginis]
MTREYPDDVAGPYDDPPRSFEDRTGRHIEVRRYDGGVDTLLEMYRRFDPEDRAQGIPPTSESQIRSWLDKLLVDDCINVVGWHEELPIGHALLVPDGQGAFELAIFVLGEYQNAGIGTELIQGLLGAGRADGVEYVWLTVERWNKPAIALYRKVGFVPTDDGSFELEMATKLLEDD